MCDKARTAVEVIKTQRRKTLTKEETLMLFQKVIEDNSKMGDRMTNLEKEVALLKEETRHGFDELNQRLHEVMEAIKNRPKTFWERIPLLKEIPTWFWIILWTIVLIFGALLGVNPDFIKHIQIGV